MKRQIDWPALIGQLKNEGHSLAKISEKTGALLSTLSEVKSEMRTPPKEWNIAVELLDYYLIHIGATPPWLGNHNEF